MRDDVFLDTNVLIYATQPNDARFAMATVTLNAGGIVSVQVLNEFVYVARRKFKRPWGEVRQALSAISDLLHPPRSITLTTHASAIAIAERDGISFYDALILASALEAGCTTLMSEDMQDGCVIDGRLTISNPFKAVSPP
jgi:predicted nucleic acid-binding protein